MYSLRSNHIINNLEKTKTKNPFMQQQKMKFKDYKAYLIMFNFFEIYFLKIFCNVPNFF